MCYSITVIHIAKRYVESQEGNRMKLTALLERLQYEVVQGNKRDRNYGIDKWFQKSNRGSVFVCIERSVSDGHQYIEEVGKKGAAAVIVEKDVEAPKHMTVIRVEDTRYALALASAAYFGYPAEQLKVIGITGTKGEDNNNLYGQIHSGRGRT